VAVTISPESKKHLIASIKRYFEEHMDGEIGDLKADLLLDYILKEIGPTIYNRAIADARAFFEEKTADLDGSCYEPEFGYWKKTKKKPFTS
jgi:uncharacterized protein (DUF2164 family)